jgi:hypothetical protein
MLEIELTKRSLDYLKTLRDRPRRTSTIPADIRAEFTKYGLVARLDQSPTGPRLVLTVTGERVLRAAETIPQ